MRMEDCIIIRKRNRKTNLFEDVMHTGVLCTMTDIISLDGSGFSENGQLVVRVPDRDGFFVACGDEISPDGGREWFTVTEVRDNRRERSGLSHWKVIGRR